MENLFLTGLTLPDLREQIKKSLSEFFKERNPFQNPPPTPEPEHRLTRKQAAEYLNCTLPTLDRYREQGRIPFYQTGRTIFFKRSEIDQALAVNPKRKAGRP